MKSSEQRNWKCPKCGCRAYDISFDLKLDKILSEAQNREIFINKNGELGFSNESGIETKNVAYSNKSFAENYDQDHTKTHNEQDLVDDMDSSSQDQTNHALPANQIEPD